MNFIETLLCTAALLAHDDVSDRLGVDDVDAPAWRQYDALEAFGNLVEARGGWEVSPALEEYLADREAFRAADQRLLGYAA